MLYDDVPTHHTICVPVLDPAGKLDQSVCLHSSFMRLFCILVIDSKRSAETLSRDISKSINSTCLPISIGIDFLA